MKYDPLTIESIDYILDAPDSDDDETESVTRSALAQLRECLVREQQPRITQIVTIDESLIALKSDGTLYTSFGGAGINWKALPLPK